MENVIHLFKSLLGGAQQPAAKTPAKHSTPSAPSKPKPAAAAGCDYRAVSLTPSLGCNAASRGASRRYLLREAPRLPLPECTMGGQCTCKFSKHADRRDSDRRLLGDTTIERWYSGSERRSRRSRRALGAPGRSISS